PPMRGQQTEQAWSRRHSRPGFFCRHRFDILAHGVSTPPTISANLPGNTRLWPWVFAGIFADMAFDPLKNLVLTSDLLRIVGDIDEFKGAWKAFGNLAPDRLATLRHVTTVESVGASTRIEGAKLTDREIDILLSNLDLGSFRTRDEQEVAGYAEATKLVFDSWKDIPLSENHIKQLHGI